MRTQGGGGAYGLYGLTARASGPLFSVRAAGGRCWHHSRTNGNVHFDKNNQKQTARPGRQTREGGRVGVARIVKGQVARQQLVGHHPGGPHIRGRVGLGGEGLWGHEPSQGGEQDGR